MEQWQLIALTMVVILIFLLLSGVWIAFSLGITGVFGLLMANPLALRGIESVCWNNINSFILTCVPLYLFMGSLMLESGVSVRFYKGLALWTDKFPGSLLHTNIVASSMFAAISGSSVATAAAIGSVAIPEMEKRGYDRAITCGSLAAGGTLGILIPPSIPFIVYGVMTAQSIGRLFVAGIIPGLILTLIFLSYILSRALKNPNLVPRHDEKIAWKNRLFGLKDVLPIVLLIISVLGGIFFGVVTPTEAAAVGSTLAIIICMAYRQLDFRVLKKSSMRALTETSMVLFILVGAQMVSFALVEAGIPRQTVALIQGSQLSYWQVFAIIVLMYLTLGMFVDALSSMLLTLPVVYPIILAYAFDPIWFGVVMVLLLEIGLITPPVGINVYVIHGIAKKASLQQVFAGSFPFVILMLAMISLLSLFPTLATWLPQYMRY